MFDKYVLAAKPRSSLQNYSNRRRQGNRAWQPRVGSLSTTGHKPRHDGSTMTNNHHFQAKAQPSTGSRTRGMPTWKFRSHRLTMTPQAFQPHNCWPLHGHGHDNTHFAIGSVAPNGCSFSTSHPPKSKLHLQLAGIEPSGFLFCSPAKCFHLNRGLDASFDRRHLFLLGPTENRNLLLASGRHKQISFVNLLVDIPPLFQAAEYFLGASKIFCWASMQKQ